MVNQGSDSLTCEGSVGDVQNLKIINNGRCGQGYPGPETANESCCPSTRFLYQQSG